MARSSFAHSSDTELQDLIDNRMHKLHTASTGGEINQLTHALRLMAQEKRRRGLSLSDEEQTLAGHKPIDDAPKRPVFRKALSGLILVAALVIAWWYAKQSGWL